MGITEGKVRAEFPVIAHLENSRYKFSPEEVDELGTRFSVDAVLIRQIESQMLLNLGSQHQRPELKLSPQLKRVLELAVDESHQMQEVVITLRVLAHSICCLACYATQSAYRPKCFTNWD